MNTSTGGFSRRTFMLLAATLAAPLVAIAESGKDATAVRTDGHGRTYHVLGVPLRSGSLYPGTEDDARAYRDAGLVQRLQAVGCNIVDEGDVAIPNYLPHHAIPPIRNWPGPRIAWDCISERIESYLRQPGHVPLLIGCDCSVVIGTTQALLHIGSTDIHVLYVDGDFDAAVPTPERVQSAASTAVWILTHESPFWVGPPLKLSQVTAIGSSNPAQSVPGLRSFTLADIRRLGAAEAARQALAGVPDSAAVVLHFDIDVFQDQQFPAAYFPHADGLNLTQASELFATLSRDPRIRVIEISEYASLRDVDRSRAATLAALVSHGLGS
jgi:arginase